MYRLILFFLVVFTSASAQIGTIPKYPKPNVILVLLNESTNKIEALQKRGMSDKIDEVKTADKQIHTSIVNDFKYNFDFCLVYFFYNKDYEAVKRKDWDNVTFYDTEHTNSPKKVSMTTFGHYYIAEVGFPPIGNLVTLDQNNPPIKESDGFEGPEGYATRRDYSLLLYDDLFKILEGKLGLTNISLRRVGNIFKPSTLEYRFIGAEVFNRKLQKYYKD